jgi:hypothetical protein
MFWIILNNRRQLGNRQIVDSRFHPSWHWPMFSSDFRFEKGVKEKKVMISRLECNKEHWDIDLKTDRLFHLESIHRALPRVELP